MAHETIRSGGMALKNIPNVVDAAWSWVNQNNGLIKWTFTNKGNSQRSFVLLRSGYYFGNAFWCVYENNAAFDVSFMQQVKPLVDKGYENNSPPLALVDFGNGNVIECFVFTLAAGQTWSMLEGGFTNGITPTGVKTYNLTEEKADMFCIGYDQQQVTDWDSQTGTSYKGYSPNPDTFATVMFSIDASAPFIELFAGDSAKEGSCPSSSSGSSSGSSGKSGKSGNGSSGSSGTTPNPQPTNTCLADLEKAIEDENFDDFIKAIECFVKNEVAVSEKEKQAFEQHAMKFLADLENAGKDVEGIGKKIENALSNLKTTVEKDL